MQYSSGTDIKIRRCLIVLHLPATIYQPLLLRRHTRLLFHLLLYARDLVIWINVELDLFPCQRLDFDQHGSFVVLGGSSVKGRMLLGLSHTSHLA